MDDLQDVFRGVGANRRFVARGSLCTPQNIGDLENGSFTGDPTPCVLGRSESSIELVKRRPKRFALESDQSRLLPLVFVASVTGFVAIAYVLRSEHPCFVGGMKLRVKSFIARQCCREFQKRLE